MSLFFSNGCNIPYLGYLGESCKPLVRAAHNWVGIPNAVKDPLPILANKLCLNERVALAFVGVSAVGLLEGAALLSTGCFFIRGTYRLVTCHPVDAFQDYSTSFGIVLTACVVGYFAKQYI